MKKIFINILLICSALLLTQCFEEKERIVKVTPFEEIQNKLKELRDLQKEVNTEEVESTDIQAKINALIAQLDALIPPNNVPLTYSIGIISAASEGQVGIANAVVTIHIKDQVITATSNSGGQVMFENLRSGVALVHITHPDYTDVNFVVDLLVDRGATDGASNSGEDFNVTSAIGLYPTSVAQGALVHSGGLFFDTDRTNDLLQNTDPDYGLVNFYDQNYNYFDGPFAPAPRLTLTNGAEDARPTAYPFLDARAQSWEGLNQQVGIFVGVQPDPFFYSFVPADTEGNIVLAVYEDMFVRTTSNANGTFSLTLPKSRRPLTSVYRFTEFEGTEKYIRAENLTGTTTNFSSRDRDVIYTPMYLITGQANYFPGSINNFDPAQVNDFEVIWSPQLTGVPLFIFYSAKSRNE